jgi:DNA-binding response OmpR family regulator
MSAQAAKRVLIIEDEVLVAMYLEDLLTAMGHHVVGPAARIDQAMKLARESDVDFAVLDVNLAGIPSFPVADILRERGVPFVFATGYGSEGVADRYSNGLTLRKPYASQDLVVAIAKCLRVDNSGTRSSC